MMFQPHPILWTVRSLVLSVGGTDNDCLSTKCNINSQYILLLHLVIVQLLSTETFPNYKCHLLPCGIHQRMTWPLHCLSGFVAYPSSHIQVAVHMAFAVWELSLFVFSFAEKLPAFPRVEVADVRSSDLK